MDFALSKAKGKAIYLLNMQVTIIIPMERPMTHDHSNTPWPMYDPTAYRICGSKERGGRRRRKLKLMASEGIAAAAAAAAAAAVPSRFGLEVGREGGFALCVIEGKGRGLRRKFRCCFVYISFFPKSFLKI